MSGPDANNDDSVQAPKRSGHVKRLPHFRFDFGSDHHELFQERGLDFGRAMFTGSIKNTSIEANGINKVYLVVWRTKLRYAARRYSLGGHLLDEAGRRIGPPLDFRARSSRAVTIVCEFPLTWTVDDQLSRVTQPARRNPNRLLPRYKYELAFEDMAGNLVDKDGYSRSPRSIDRYWSWDNAWERLKDGRPLPMVRYVSRIAWEQVPFGLQRLARMLGL